MGTNMVAGGKPDSRKSHILQLQQEQQMSAQILAVVVLRTHTWPSAAARDWNTQWPHMAAQAT